MKAFYIGLFGMVGVYARYYVGEFFAKSMGVQAPFGTFLINVSGAFLLGVAYALGAERSVLSPDLRLGIMVGLLGGFTTFSTYCFETLTLVQQREYLLASGYLMLSPLLGCVGVLGGILLVRKLYLP